MRRSPAAGITLVETIISIVLIVVLLAILLPALESGRVISHRDNCANNQRQLGAAWGLYLEEHNGQFPTVLVQPAWRYGGVRFSAATDQPFLDMERPLTRYLSSANAFDTDLFRCPADSGITDAAGGVGTGERSAFRSFGTSYRANACICDARGCGLQVEPRGLRRGEITTSPDRLILLGDATWFEVLEQTGRHADWHGKSGAGNVLFMDGSVRFITLTPTGTNVATPDPFESVSSQDAP